MVATAHASANTPTRTDSPTVLGRSPMIGLDQSSDHEIDNIETIHLDESNENEEIEGRFRSNVSSPTQTHRNLAPLPLNIESF